jgi:cation transport regulator ChaC
MFGYGSLLLRQSMERTLGHPFAQQPIECTLTGWRRSWDVFMPNRGFYEKTEDEEFVPENIIYLNLRPVAGDRVNGLLYCVTEEEFSLFDEREWIYDRVRITADFEDIELADGEAYAYVAKPQWILDGTSSRAWAALRASYLSIVEAGLNELGMGFREVYDRSTDPVPAHRVFADLRRENSEPLARS